MWIEEVFSSTFTIFGYTQHLADTKKNMSSKRDKAVLNAIFNPLLPVGSDVPPEDDDEEITNIGESFF